jgi:hypothetical protein
MTAIERITKAAREAGLTLRPNSVLDRAVVLLAANGDHVIVEADKAGRLVTANRHTAASASFATMPASGLEARILSWIISHGTPPAPVDPSVFAEPGSVQTPAEGPFEIMERSNEAADAFAQGGASGLRQLDERRRLPRTPHAFEGITAGVADRPCTRIGCGLADRHPIHGGYTAEGGLTQLAETGDLVVVRVEPDVFEVRQHGEAISFLGAEAESLRDQLVELLGPAPTDVR